MSVLRFLFEPKHPQLAQLIAGCTDESTRLRFEAIADGSIKKTDYSSARRLIDGVCTSPSFLARCAVDTFDLPRFLLDRGILIVEGGSHGNLSIDAMQTMMGAIILKVSNIARNRWKAYPRILLVLDEATNAYLIGSYETRAMAELQKCGLDFRVLVQNLNFPTTAITSDVLTNCVRHEWFFVASSDLQRKAVSDLGDQELRSGMISLKTGERFVKDRTRVYREYVTPLPDLWTYSGLGRARQGRAGS